MSLADSSGTVAASMGVLMALAPMLQLRRVLQMRDAAEVSIGLFFVWVAGSCAWLWHGFATSDAVLIVPNVVALLTNLATVLVVLRYRAGSPAGATIEDTGAPRTG